jgi:hypothetical protein
MGSVSDIRVESFTFSASYTTGGEAYAPSGFDHPSFVVLPQPKGGYAFDYDYAAKKLKAYRQTAATGPLAEVAAAVNVGAAGPVTVLILPRT